MHCNDTLLWKSLPHINRMDFLFNITANIDTLWGHLRQFILYSEHSACYLNCPLIDNDIKNSHDLDLPYYQLLLSLWITWNPNYVFFMTLFLCNWIINNSIINAINNKQTENNLVNVSICWRYTKMINFINHFITGDNWVRLDSLE